MKYQDQSFTLPVCVSKISDLEYALRVGNITQSEYEALGGHQPQEGLSNERSENSSPSA